LDFDTAIYSDILPHYVPIDIPNPNPIEEFLKVGRARTITHVAGIGNNEGVDFVKNVEFFRFSDGITDLEDGSPNKKSSKVLSTANQTIGSLSITAPTYTSDGDGEYTVNIAAVEPDLEYNIAYMIDVSASMTAAELQATKDAYIELTNFYINQGVAESSTFAVIPYNGSASLYLSSNPSQVTSYINSLTTTTGTTSYASTFAKAKI
jgi:hypothetical protein